MLLLSKFGLSLLFSCWLLALIFPIGCGKGRKYSVCRISGLRFGTTSSSWTKLLKRETTHWKLDYRRCFGCGPLLFFIAFMYPISCTTFLLLCSLSSGLRKGIFSSIISSKGKLVSIWRRSSYPFLSTFSVSSSVLFIVLVVRVIQKFTLLSVWPYLFWS